MIRSVLGSRASIGGPLGSGRGGAAAAWYLAGGVSAANCVAAYTPKGAASLAASYDNNAAPGNGLADGTYDAAPGTAPTLTADGWYATNTQYLRTGIIPASGWSMIARFVNLQAESGGDTAVMGSYGGSSTYFFLQPRFAGSDAHYYGNGGLSSAIAPRLSNAVMAIAGNSGYLNGSLEATSMAAWSGTGKEIYLIGFNNNGTLGASTPPTGSIAAVAIYNTTLTAPQVAALSAAMAAL